MTNVFDDEKKIKLGEATGQKIEDKKFDEQKELLKAEAKAELEAEGIEATKKAIEERSLLIKKIQGKKTKSSEDKEILKRELVARAKDNVKLPKDLETLRGSQMTLQEMLQYCKTNKIEYVKGDNTILLRARIKAFRNPGQAERLKMLENKPFMGKTVR